MKYFLSIFFSFFVLIKSSAFDSLLAWGKNHSLDFSSKISMNYVSENNHSYVAKNIIIEGETILEIPYDIMLNIEKALYLFNSQKLYDLYEKYKDEQITYNQARRGFRTEQSFLAYLMYIVHRQPKKYQKGGFYQYYQNIFNCFETNMDSFPLFYSPEQINIFRNTSFGSIVDLADKYYHEEADIFEKKIFKKTVVYDEYLRFRTFTISKSYNISGHSTIVPFIDLFPASHLFYNVNYTIEHDHIRVYATKNIFPDENIIIKAPIVPNTNGLLLSGRTYEEMIDYIPSCNILAVNSGLLENLGIKPSDFNSSVRIELLKPNFFEDSLEVYKNLSLKIKQDGSDLSAYKLFLRNLELSRNNFDRITTSVIHRVFVQTRDIYNAKRIFRGEIHLIDKKINKLRDVIHELETTGKVVEQREKDHTSTKTNAEPEHNDEDPEDL